MHAGEWHHFKITIKNAKKEEVEQLFSGANGANEQASTPIGS